MKFIKKVPILEEIKDLRLDLEKNPDKKKQEFIINEYGVKVVLSIITSAYLLKIKYDNFNEYVLKVAKSPAPLVSATKNFIYNLLDTVDVFRDDCENVLSKRRVAYSNVLHDGVFHFYAQEYLLNEIYLIRRFELGMYYLHYYSNELFNSLTQNEESKIEQKFKDLSLKETEYLIDKELEKVSYGSKLKIYNKYLLRNIFLYKFNKKHISNNLLYKNCFYLEESAQYIIAEQHILELVTKKIVNSLGRDRGMSNDNGPKLSF